MSRERKKAREARARVRRRTRKGAPLPEWLTGAAAAAPRALLCADRAVVEGYTSIADISPEQVVLETRRGTMRVEGEGLEIDRLREGSVAVRGRIASVRLGKGNGHARA